MYKLTEFIGCVALSGMVCLLIGYICFPSVFTNKCYRKARPEASAVSYVQESQERCNYKEGFYAGYMTAIVNPTTNDNDVITLQDMIDDEVNAWSNRVPSVSSKFGTVYSIPK